MMMDFLRLLTGVSRQESEKANADAYNKLTDKLSACGIEGLDDIDRMMRKIREEKLREE